MEVVFLHANNGESAIELLQRENSLGHLKNACVIIHDSEFFDNEIHPAYLEFRKNITQDTEMSLFGFKDIKREIYLAFAKKDPMKISNCYPLDFWLLRSLKLGKDIDYKSSENPDTVYVVFGTTV
jgi:hypothetical protein